MARRIHGDLEGGMRDPCVRARYLYTILVRFGILVAILKTYPYLQPNQCSRCMFPLALGIKRYRRSHFSIFTSFLYILAYLPNDNFAHGKSSKRSMVVASGLIFALLALASLRTTSVDKSGIAPTLSPSSLLQEILQVHPNSDTFAGAQDLFQVNI